VLHKLEFEIQEDDQEESEMMISSARLKAEEAQYLFAKNLASLIFSKAKILCENSYQNKNKFIFG